MSLRLAFARPYVEHSLTAVPMEAPDFLFGRRLPRGISKSCLHTDMSQKRQKVTGFPNVFLQSSDLLSEPVKAAGNGPDCQVACVCDFPVAVPLRRVEQDFEIAL